MQLYDRIRQLKAQKMLSASCNRRSKLRFKHLFLLMEGVRIQGPIGFEETMKQADEDTLVYCDPPYFPLTETSNFTQYSDKSGFGPEMQEKLAVAAAA